MIFLVKLNILATPLYILNQLNISFPQLQEAIAYLSTLFLKFIGIQASLKGYFINASFGLSSTIIEISFDCTGWKSAYALFALAIATPSISFRKKLKFLLISLPLLFLINIFRIVLTIYLFFILSPKYFGIIHDFLWQWGLIAIILCFWIFWLRHEKKIIL